MPIDLEDGPASMLLLGRLAQLRPGSAARLGTRAGTITYIAAGFADVDFPGGDWSVVPLGRLEPVGD